MYCIVTTVRQHPLDDSSLEVKIAVLTVKIRNYHRDLIERYPYKNQPLKHNMTSGIALRRRLLGNIHTKNVLNQYKKFGVSFEICTATFLIFFFMSFNNFKTFLPSINIWAWVCHWESINHAASHGILLNQLIQGSNFFIGR